MRPILFIPYVNREDLLERACSSVEKHFDVIVIDNSPKQNLFELKPYRYSITTPSVPLNFVSTQNFMLKLAKRYEVPYYAFMHNDGEAVEDTPQQLINYTERLIKSGEKFGAIYTYYDVLAVFSVEGMEAIGGWSIYFEQYYADCDTYRRLRLAGYPTLDTGLKVNHYNGNDASATLKSDKRLALRNDLVSGMFHRIYQIRWGGDVGSEKYSTPFDIGDITL